MFLLKKFIFKLMEMGLGVRPYFSLETKYPIFVNFKLSPEEVEHVKKALPSRFTLRKIRFCQSDAEPEYWVSYNLYEIKYPKKELASIRKARCEINTFVEDRDGRKGVYVFCGSPFVSKETRPSLFGFVCDLAERLVMFIYGCGKLTKVEYTLDDKRVRIDCPQLALSGPITGGEEKLSSDYWRFNDVSFFNEGKTFDLVNVNSAFYAASFQSVEPGEARVDNPFFKRSPDKVYVHQGEIAYLVSSMNLVEA